ncbi:MAG: AAA family ATPase [Planctomycetes bacterium]|nr:AAA family ATPase [Planctomycetota bacterium]
MSSKTILLLTGRPGIGKTTVIRKVAEALSGCPLGGFYTAEVRSGEERTGFRIVSFGGLAGRLAEAGLPSPFEVGRYGVDLEGFEAVALPALELQDDVPLYLVDEIGKMECFSTSFVAAMRRLLDSGRRVVATVAESGEGFSARVKRRPDAGLWQVTLENRDVLPDRVLQWVG